MVCPLWRSSAVRLSGSSGRKAAVNGARLLCPLSTLRTHRLSTVVDLKRHSADVAARPRLNAEFDASRGQHPTAGRVNCRPNPAPELTHSGHRRRLRWNKWGCPIVTVSAPATTHHRRLRSRSRDGGDDPVRDVGADARLV